MAMDEVYIRFGVLSAIPLLGEKLVGTLGDTVHIRCLHNQEDSLAMVEGR